MGREKLRVEIAAEELVAEIARVLRKIPYQCDASKHLEKAGNSALFNLGEGIVAYKPRVKAGKYEIARGEAKEVEKAARALVAQRRLTQADIAQIEELCDYLIAALTNMIKGLEARF